ncbi:MAG: hybrid sensor histidine kinase/response regulator [Desulfococcaceae bacterium]|jgi:two-component system chemotaxis sensor kinase CheA|nr:hybrid sensor histidine kinase/response regulator [Desulfococcaceae bacterium]
MGRYADENTRLFIDESLEHLSDIENELLAIEQRGADIDENLVNKVYRAAHSIKGGAGFMGLANIKNLTHEMENVLGKIRSREIVPDATSINVLLLAADTLRNLLNDIENSDDADISGHMESLNSINGALPEPQKDRPKAEQPSADRNLKAVTTVAGISFPGEKQIFSVAEEDIFNIRREGKFLYLIRLPAMENNALSGMTDDMRQCGMILNSRPELPFADTPDTVSEGFRALFATVLKPSDLACLLNAERKDIFIVNEDRSVRPAGADRDEEEDGEFSCPEPKEIRKKAGADFQEDAGEDAEEPESHGTVQEAEEEISGPGTESVTDSIKADSSRKFLHSHPETLSDEPPVSKSETPAEPVKFQTSLRVNINLLDLLMTLAGELVLSRNQLLRAIIRNNRRALEISGQRIDLITSELQEAIMHTRMQPINNIFNKFPRVVRDLAISLNKNIELTIEGREVELDKSIIESLNDPMTHLIRNAADHGIESPRTRIRQGKDPVGRIHLKAYHEAGQVNIEIRDDGRGMDGESIAASAVAKGLLTEDAVRGMSDREKISLIFLPGFSMSEKITDISGRGVGMDVVKTNLDRLGGIVDIDSEPGKGSSIHIKLPLTLAIIPSLLVSDAEERYAIPQVNVVELLRIGPSQIRNRIEHVGNAQVVRLRNKLLPLLRLGNILRPEPSDRASDRPSDRKNPLLINEKRGINIVVVSTGIFKYGIIVDRLHDSEEIVVKPLGRHLTDCQGYAGATILGDGRVALILDVADLARMAELASVSASVRDAASEGKVPLPAEDQQTLLLFRNSEKTRFAVPLELVERIEKIRCRDIEIAAGRRVIQYRDTSMPLFDIGDVAQVDKFEEREYALVIVFFVAGIDVGILAIPPIDSIKTACRIDETTLMQPGILGSAVIDGKTTLMVDIIGVVESLHPEWFTVERQMKRKTGKSRTILLAEDTRLFRNQIKCAIEDAGYHVLEAEDGMIAWDLLEKNADRVSLVVTDLEMPNLDGFGFTRQIKNDKRFSHLPVIAVSSLAGKEDIRKAKICGIDEYQIKLDRKKLVECIRHYLGKTA